MTRATAPGEIGTLPDFEAPPVVEVVLSVGFQPLDRLGVITQAELWRTKFRDSLPKVEEQPPYEIPIESIGSTGDLPAISFQLLRTVPLPRLWFLDDTGSQLVQIQNNWLARNWRRVQFLQDYPRYPAMRTSFWNDLETLQGYVLDNGMGSINPTQCEVTYINHIEYPDGAATGDLGSILRPILSPPIEPGVTLESARWGAQYILVKEEKRVGRLHVTADPANRRSDGAAVVVLTLTARGAPIGEGLEGIVAFLDLGRKAALDTFLAITRPEMHRLWRKTHD